MAGPLQDLLMEGTKVHLFLCTTERKSAPAYGVRELYTHNQTPVLLNGLTAVPPAVPQLC
jgi:hypothetical protein